MKGNGFKSGLSTFKVIFVILGTKYAQKSTLFPKLVPVIWPFWGPKKSFFRLFESCFGDVPKLFRHYFWP